MWFTGHGHSLQVLCLFSLSWLALTSCAFCGVYWVSTSCQDLYWAFSHISHLVFPGAFHVNTQASCHRRRDWRLCFRFPDCGDEVLPTSSIHSTELCTGHDSANTLGVGGRSLSQSWRNQYFKQVCLTQRLVLFHPGPFNSFPFYFNSHGVALVPEARHRDAPVLMKQISHLSKRMNTDGKLSTGMAELLCLWVFVISFTVP